MKFIDNLKLSQKLTMLLLLPILCILYFSSVNLYQNWLKMQEMKQVEGLVNISIHLSNFMHETQKGEVFQMFLWAVKGLKWAAS